MKKNLCGPSDSKMCLILNIENKKDLLKNYEDLPIKHSKDNIRFFYVKKGFSEELDNS